MKSTVIALSNLSSKHIGSVWKNAKVTHVEIHRWADVSSQDTSQTALTSGFAHLFLRYEPKTEK